MKPTHASISFYLSKCSLSSGISNIGESHDLLATVDTAMAFLVFLGHWEPIFIPSSYLPSENCLLSTFRKEQDRESSLAHNFERSWRMRNNEVWLCVCVCCVCVCVCVTISGHHSSGEWSFVNYHGVFLPDHCSLDPPKLRNTLRLWRLALRDGW